MPTFTHTPTPTTTPNVSSTRLRRGSSSRLTDIVPTNTTISMERFSNNNPSIEQRQSPSLVSSSSSSSSYNENFEDKFELTNVVSAYLNKDAFDGLVVPIFPESSLPLHLPLSRFRHIFYNIATKPGNSHIGNLYFVINTLTIIMSITSFCLASLADHRIRRLKKEYLLADRHLQYIDLACLSFFAFDYFSRLLCVTCEPFTQKEKEAFKLYGNWRNMVNRRFNQMDALAILQGKKLVTECTLLNPHPPLSRFDDENPIEQPYIPIAFRSTSISSSTTLSSSSSSSPSHTSSSANDSASNSNAVVNRTVNFVRNLFPSSLILNRTFHVLVYFILEPTNMMDFISILPFFLNNAIQSLDFMGLEERNGDTTSLLILRVVRVSKIAPLIRFTGRLPVVKILFRALYDASEALVMLFIFLTLGVILFGSMIFFCESGVWDENLNTWLRPTILGTSQESTPFRSIPQGMWWAVVTLATVGYGDFVPTTPWGKVVGGLAIACGLVMLAMPMTVIGSTFTNEYVRYKADLAAGGDGFSLDYEAAENVSGGPHVFAQGVTDSLASNINMMKVHAEISHMHTEFKIALKKLTGEMDEVLENQIQEKELLSHGLNTNTNEGLHSTNYSTSLGRSSSIMSFSSREVPLDSLNSAHLPKSTSSKEETAKSLKEEKTSDSEAS
jgi:voltage-gated potassium channel Kch